MESGQSKFSKPNFLIVGAAKAGTTSLANYLNAHPDIFIPKKKELRYFVKDILNSINDKDSMKKNGFMKTSVFDKSEYYSQFEGNEKLAGEASVHYLYHHKDVIPRILDELGDIPIIIILRNPVTRAISNYEYLSSFHYNTLEKELLLEESKINKNFNSFWYYKRLGLYSSQVADYLINFSNVKVLIFEDFIDDTEGQMNELFKFLKIKPIKVNEKVFNRSRIHSSARKFIGEIGLIKIIKIILSDKQFHYLKKNLSRYNYKKNNQKGQYDQNTICELCKYFESDIIKLEGLLNKDLSIWKNYNSNYNN